MPSPSPLPTLVRQSGDHAPGRDDDLRQARSWTYRAVFRRDSHPPQDRLKIAIGFNHWLAAATGRDDAFELFEADNPADAYVLAIDTPPRCGSDAPLVQLPGFDTVRCTGAEPWTPPAHRARIEAGTVLAYAFAPAARAAGTPLLSPQDGRRIGERCIVLPDLDVLVQQDARMAISVGDMPAVTFTEPLQPMLSDSRVLRIDRLAAAGEVATASLRTHLQALWERLFADASARNTVQCTVRYVYAPGVAGPLVVSQPLALLPPTGPGEVAAPALLDKLAAAIETWFQANMPPDGGDLVFDLRVMGANAMPLLALPNLTLPMGSIAAE